MAEDRLRILLIEHDTGFTRAVGDMLQQVPELDVELHPADDLPAGLDVLNALPVDLVLLDAYLPDGAGLGNVALLRAEAPHVPIIVAGDSDDEVVALEAVHAGAQDYLVKSQITPGWLDRSIRYAIERHHMDMALLAAEEKYHSVFDHLVEGIFQTTPDGRYLMANMALARIYGYAAPEDLISSLTDISHRLYVDEGRRDEFVRIMQEHDTITGFESQVYRADGTMIWISENCRAIRDARGRLLYYEGTVEDITQRRQAEERLRNSEALYHSLVETLPQNIFRKDLNLHFTFGNTQFCRILGHPLEEIVGRTDFDFFPRTLAEKYQRDDRQVIETGCPQETVEEHQPPGKDKMFVQVVKTPLNDADGRTIGLQGIFWDITAQRMAEERIRRANALLAQSQQELRSRNQEMEADLRMAREIQLTMLPQQYPSFPRSAPAEDSALRFTHRYLPTGTVGGDFFSVAALSETEAGVFICDVAGHGVRSSLVTAMIRALVEELRPVAHDPGQFLTKLNQDLYAILKHTGSPMLTTAIYLVADCQTGVMRYGNAGHPKPLLIRRSRNEVAPLVNQGGKSQPVLGLVESFQYRASEVALAPGDLVMLFTDGLFEVQGPRDELFTQEMLVDAVRKRAQMPPGELFDALLEGIRSFAGERGFSDDVCLVGMEVAAAIAGK
jgi:sigma-B regulation protein RsbU (phosphoserine phosphatase)